MSRTICLLAAALLGATFVAGFVLGWKLRGRGAMALSADGARAPEGEGAALAPAGFDAGAREGEAGAAAVAGSAPGPGGRLE